jgi:hypothetical protein
MSFLFGGSKVETPEQARLANIKPREMGTNQAAQPVPVLWGIRKIGGTFITDLFFKKAKKIVERIGTGKGTKKVTIGYNYYASYAMALCMGPVDSIRAVYSNDKAIWTGEVNRASADYATIATEIGNLRIYWGTGTQAVDSILAEYQISDGGSSVIFAPMPAFRNVCYVVADNVFFGQATSPPNLTFVLARRSSGLTLSAHHLSDDAVLPECVYDLLTNPVYGAALPAGKVDVDTFVAAAEQVIDEDLGVSPLLESTADLRGVLGTLLAYGNGAVASKNGKVQMLLQRTPAETPIVIGPDELLEEPEISRASWAETWSETRVTFTDRARDYDSAVAVYSDAANAAVAGLTQKEFQRGHVTRESVALGMAAVIGTQGGQPLSSVKLVVSPSVVLEPGDPFTLYYPPLGIAALPLTVRKMDLGGPDKPMISIEAVEDLSRLSEAGSLFITDPPDVPVIPEEDPGVARLQFAKLPAELLDGKPDGVLICASRPKGTTLGYGAWTNWKRYNANPTTDWKLALDSSSFPMNATLNRWKDYGSYLLFDVTLEHDHDNESLIDFRDQQATLYGATLAWSKASSGGSYSLSRESAWIMLRPGGRFAAMTDPRRWEIEVISGQFSSQGFRTTPYPVYYPSAQIYLGRLTDFALITFEDDYYFARAGQNHPDDLEQIRCLKVTTYNSTKTEMPLDNSGNFETYRKTTEAWSDDFQAVVAPTSW